MPQPFAPMSGGEEEEDKPGWFARLWGKPLGYAPLSGVQYGVEGTVRGTTEEQQASVAMDATPWYG